MHCSPNEHPESKKKLPLAITINHCRGQEAKRGGDSKKEALRTRTD